MSMKPMNFIDKITPLDHAHLQPIVDNITELYHLTGNLIAGDPTGAGSVLPSVSGDGIIRYVVNIKVDMLYRSDVMTNVPSGANPGDRYFVAVQDAHLDKYYYHLEIWNVINDNGTNKWQESDAWAEEIDHNPVNINYSKRCWDRCTHDKLYICQNTNKCYYMIDANGCASFFSRINSGTTDQAASFMTETAQAASVVFKGDRKGWETYDGEMDCGIPIEWLYRFKMIVMSFDIVDGTNWPEGSDTHQLINVAFDPWWYHGNELFVPICNMYNFNSDDANKSITYGLLEINNRNDESGGTDKRFRFKVWLPSSQGGSIGATYKSIYIRAIVGVADISLDWDHAAHN